MLWLFQRRDRTIYSSLAHFAIFSQSHAPTLLLSLHTISSRGCTIPPSTRMKWPWTVRIQPTP
ncbi:hypothetical protein BDQ12DRAFT_687442 [Crucibulum laeve]|uniref:Uncharacterized protein n=1 Tax=Crucibulum laeve TaxID=68775 RepID=A0A5C3LV20_9AGAR|nr:hypothetical protein BDQ12DRAFT_687442 [Crucibulum laeve]